MTHQMIFVINCLTAKSQNYICPNIAINYAFLCYGKLMIFVPPSVPQTQILNFFDDTSKTYYLLYQHSAMNWGIFKIISHVYAELWWLKTGYKCPVSNFWKLSLLWTFALTTNFKNTTFKVSYDTFASIIIIFGASQL